MNLFIELFATGFIKKNYLKLYFHTLFEEVVSHVSLRQAEGRTEWHITNLLIYIFEQLYNGFIIYDGNISPTDELVIFYVCTYLCVYIFI